VRRHCLVDKAQPIELAAVILKPLQLVAEISGGLESGLGERFDRVLHGPAGEVLRGGAWRVRLRALKLLLHCRQFGAEQGHLCVVCVALIDWSPTAVLLVVERAKHRTVVVEIGRGECVIALK
jgi:hypothetical protein